MLSEKTKKKLADWAAKYLKSQGEHVNLYGHPLAQLAAWGLRKRGGNDEVADWIEGLAAEDDEYALHLLVQGPEDAQFLLDDMKDEWPDARYIADQVIARLDIALMMWEHDAPQVR